MCAMRKLPQGLKQKEEQKKTERKQRGDEVSLNVLKPEWRAKNYVCISCVMKANLR